MEGIKDAINNLLVYDIDLGLNNISISEVNEEEWATAWKKYYNPVKISEKFTIVPTWETYEPVSSDEKIIELIRGWRLERVPTRQRYFAYRRSKEPSSHKIK